MKHTIKLILFIPLLCLSACSKDIPAVFEVIGMSMSNSDNTGEKPVDAAGAVPKDAYAIKMTLDEVMRKKTDGDAQDNGFTNEDKLTSLNISSLTSFDATHPAGSSLNAYFLTQLSPSATIASFVSKGLIGGGSFKDGNYIDSWSTYQYLYLMTPPAAPGIQTFVVKIDMSDGRTMTDTVTVHLY